MCYAKPGPRCAAHVNKTMAKANEKINYLTEEKEAILNEVARRYFNKKVTAGNSSDLADLSKDKLDLRMEVLDAEQKAAEAELRYAQEEYLETPQGAAELEDSINRLREEGRDAEANVAQRRWDKAAIRRGMKMNAYRKKYGGKKDPEEDREQEFLRRRYVETRGKEQSDTESFDVNEVKDQVTYEGRTFYRSRPGQYPGTPYAIRIQANRELSFEEAQRLAGLTGYAYRSTVAGERLSNPELDSPNSFIVAADTTKSARDDLGMALADFEDSLPSLTKEGTPVRKTDRKGPGTKGTRLVDGLGDDLEIEIYYDNAYDEDGKYLD